MKKILFIVNKKKESAMAIAERLVRYAKSADYECEVGADFPLPKSAFEDKDICCAIGGDGTILSCVSNLVEYKLPIFGINLGKLGFLANYNEEISREDFLKLVSDLVQIQSRALLSAKFNGKKYFALNDFVMKNSKAAGISSFKITADDEFIAAYVGDGLIFATPTGTTAYNMSAGGPLIHPRMRAFVMTPICPHTLSNHSLIYDDKTTLKVTCLSGGSALVADGIEIAALSEGDEIEISMPDQTLKFARIGELSHFAILRNKLGWAEDPRRHSK